MPKIDQQFNNILDAFKVKGFRKNSIGIPTLSNISFEVDLDEFPLLSVEEINLDLTIKEFIQTFCEEGEFNPDLEDPSTNQIDEAIQFLEERKYTKPLMRAVDKGLNSIQIVVKDLVIHERIKYCEEDVIYLNALWEKSHKNDKEATARLKKALKNVSDKGFILTASITNCSLLEVFTIISQLSILSYLIGAVTNIIPISIFINGVNIKCREDIVEKRRNIPSAYSLPYLSYSKELTKFIEDCQKVDIPFTQFLKQVEKKDLIINNYTHGKNDI